MADAHVNGVRLHYELSGPADAPVLVLNNGILMSTASWVRQVPAFSQRYRVLAYDMRDQGQSEHPPGGESMELHADDLAALLDALGVVSAHVLGISYGGEVAQAFALRHGRRVRSLVLADTVSEIGPELRAIAEGWRRVAASGDADAFFDVTAPWNFSPAFIAANTAVMADARRRYRDLDMTAVVRLADAFLGVDFTGRLSQLAVPTCVLVGELDLLKGRAYAERIATTIPQAELHIVAGAGHAACWERADAFNTIVLGFLAKQD